jgi:hypothetical protein
MYHRMHRNAGRSENAHRRQAGTISVRSTHSREQGRAALIHGLQLQELKLRQELLRLLPLRRRLQQALQVPQLQE